MSDPKEVFLDPAAVSEHLLDARDKLHQSLIDIGKMKAADNPDWRPALLSMFSKYCAEIGFDITATFPIERLYQELAEPVYKARGEIAPNSFAISKFIGLNVAAAMLTVLDKRGAFKSVAAAAEAVAKGSGLSQTEIESHRHLIGRGKRDQATTEAYQRHLTQLSDWSTEDLLKQASLLHEFVT